MDNIKEKIICEQRCDEGLRFFKDNICGSLRTIDACGDKRVIEIATATTMSGRNNEYGKCEQRIRKLTPKECFRLQGFDDDSFRRAEKVNSNTQLYHQAGNSICVPVIQYILQNLFECGVLNIE